MDRVLFNKIILKSNEKEIVLIIYLSFFLQTTKHNGELLLFYTGEIQTPSGKDK